MLSINLSYCLNIQLFSGICHFIIQ